MSIRIAFKIGIILTAVVLTVMLLIQGDEGDWLMSLVTAGIIPTTLLSMFGNESKCCRWPW